MARQAEASLQDEFGLPLGLIGIDTIAACAGYKQAGDEYDNAVGQAIMNVLKMVAQELECFAGWQSASTEGASRARNTPSSFVWLRRLRGMRTADDRARIQMRAWPGGCGARSRVVLN